MNSQVFGAVSVVVSQTRRWYQWIHRMSGCPRWLPLASMRSHRNGCEEQGNQQMWSYTTWSIIPLSRYFATPNFRSHETAIWKAMPQPDPEGTKTITMLMKTTYELLTGMILCGILHGFETTGVSWKRWHLHTWALCQPIHLFAERGFQWCNGAGYNCICVNISARILKVTSWTISQLAYPVKWSLHLWEMSPRLATFNKNMPS